jgi:decaprenylphospho-beta-D-ribofuranose 2-oxidase
MRFAEQRLSGWGNYPVQAARVFRPRRWAEALEVIAQTNGTGVLARGLGRSYGDAALNEGGNVLLSGGFDHFLSFDEATGVVECESGVTFADLLDVFLPRGFFPPVTPGTKHVTIGGAIAADVHGKNHHRDGSIAFAVEDFRLATGTGEIIACSREQNADAFWATIGGMGLTGVILSARIRLKRVSSAYMIVDEERVKDLDAALERFAATDGQYQYSVAWIDCLASGASLGRTVIMQGSHAEPEQLSTTQRTAPFARERGRKLVAPFFAPGFILGPASVRLLNNAYYRSHPSRGGVVCHCERFFYPLDAVANWNRIYGKRGFVQYQVAFESATSRQGLIELLEHVAKSRRASFLAVLKAFGQADEGFISFARPGYTLSLDIANTGPELVALARTLDAIALKHGGRVYLAKDACLSAESFAAMYPGAAQFKAVKQRLDPSGRFSSSLARRVGLVETH